MRMLSANTIALVAVMIFFRKDIIKICRALVIACKDRNWADNEAKLGLYILLGTFLTVLVAFPL